jgi:type IV secretory pathway TrbL component
MTLSLSKIIFMVLLIILLFLVGISGVYGSYGLILGQAGIQLSAPALSDPLTLFLNIFMVMALVVFSIMAALGVIEKGTKPDKL